MAALYFWGTLRSTPLEILLVLRICKALVRAGRARESASPPKWYALCCTSDMRTHFVRRRVLVFAAAAMLLLISTGCREQDKSNFTDADLHLTPEQAQGRHLYRQYCASCHQAYISNALNGPSLKDLYNKKSMPSGAPPSDQRVGEVIMRGRKMMPSFSDGLDPRQVEALIAYLHTL